MYGLREMLLEEQARLEEIVKIAKKELESAPKGKLRLSKKGERTQYYYIEEDKTETYIRKGNETLISRLAQKPYDEEVIKLAKRRLQQIKKITKDYSDNEIEEIFYKQHPARQRFIQPIEPTWEERLEEWMQKEYAGKEFSVEAPVIFTEKGERVRSKSEKILADYFAKQGIAYKYEKPLYLKGMGTIYPDFTFLSKKTGEEIYWEHNGMMNDPVYARNAIRKWGAYLQNGIFQGERLILTYETEQNVLNTAIIKSLVEKYLT